MAAIDKIYGSREERRELKRFIRRLRLPGYVKRSLFARFYPLPGGGAITCFHIWQDQLLYKQPDLPGWARARIEDQYNGSPSRPR